MSVRGDVSASELNRHLRAITAEVRLSGSPEEARAFDYIAQVLESFGYEVQRFANEALIGYPLRSSLRVFGDKEEEIHCNGYALSPSTGPDGVTGELVYVGAGMPADFAEVDVRGKIAISDGMAMPIKARASSIAGAIGHIHVDGASPRPKTPGPDQSSEGAPSELDSGQYDQAASSAVTVPSAVVSSRGHIRREG